MTEILVLIVLAAIVKLMLVTVLAGVRYQRRRDAEAPRAVLAGPEGPALH